MFKGNSVEGKNLEILKLASKIKKQKSLRRHRVDSEQLENWPLSESMTRREEESGYK